jgi:CubicO group peptidase (beta-lactamase class C family)
LNLVKNKIKQTNSIINNKTKYNLSNIGKGYLYSTFGYTMLSAVLEKASKDTPFPKLLTELFRRMDMNETYLDVNDAIVPYRAKYYLRDANKRLVNVPYVDVSYKYGGGGILSNVYDLCKLGNNLIASYQDCNDGTRKLLKASTMRNQVWATQSNPERSFLNSYLESV